MNIYATLLIALSFYACASVRAYHFLDVYPRIKLEASDAGDPLILTPFLKNGSIHQARDLAKVPLTMKMGFKSYAGFFTINEKYNSNLYFWYFPPFSKDPNAPVILWLQGGPGGSSLFGLFMENGPLIATEQGFEIRKYHWALKYHVIFIDNPVGTGFSFTKDENGYCKDERCVGVGLYNAMNQFFTLFPMLRSNDFYISGESYAGKYIPSLAMQIHRRNAMKQEKINLKGLAMGNAYCDPINQMDYGNYLYQHGFLDDNQLQIFLQMEEKIKDAITNGNYAVADMLMAQLMDGDEWQESYFQKFTGLTNYYNFLVTEESDDSAILAKLLSNDKVRRSVHVGGLPFNSGQEVQLNLALDILKSVATVVGNLLSHYKVMVYNGQLDIIVAYPLTENFISHLNFSSADEYKNADRHIWKVDDEIAGYYKKAGNLTEVLVRNAGHMVPSDQPKWALDMLTRFIENKF